MGGKVTIGGMISGVRTITTKSKQTMAFVQIEGLSGKTEVTVMPNVYSRFGTLCEEGSIVMVTGNLEISNYTASRGSDEDDEELLAGEKEEEEKNFQILADRLLSADVMLRGSASAKHTDNTRREGLHIVLKPEQMGMLEQIKSILTGSRGSYDVYIHANSSGSSTLLRLGPVYKSGDDALKVQRLESVLGKGSSWFVK